MEQAALHPATLGMTMVLGIALILVPRNLAVIPIVIGAVFIPFDQRVIVGGIDFPMLRILVLFGAARLLWRHELRPIRFGPMDWFVIAHAVTEIVARTLLTGAVAMLVNRLGAAFTALGIYFFCRLTLRSWSDLAVVIRAGAGCAMFLAAAMAVEWTTGRNPFSLIGAVPEETVVRLGRFRCQGAFPHPIMAGLFGAVWAPPILALWFRKERVLALTGLLAAGLVVLFSSSSTPLLSLVLGLGALAMWPLRLWLRPIQFGVVGLLVVIHFVRDKPVWHLLARVNVISGSTGWHRYHLIDQTIKRFGEWWLFGSLSTAHWGRMLFDVTNQYVATAINGGVLSLTFFVGTIVAGFAAAGRAAKLKVLTRWKRMLAWGLGSMLLAHAAAFMAVSYFGQMRFVLYLQFAMLGGVAALVRRDAMRAPVGAPRKAHKSPPALAPVRRQPDPRAVFTARGLPPKATRLWRPEQGASLARPGKRGERSEARGKPGAPQPEREPTGGGDDSN